MTVFDGGKPIVIPHAEFKSGKWRQRQAGLVTITWQGMSVEIELTSEIELAFKAALKRQARRKYELSDNNSTAVGDYP